MGIAPELWGRVGMGVGVKNGTLASRVQGFRLQ